ncbi:hypothetical protein DUI87_21099 [Hirundo rustica rustica]|uniref:Uncharacterized protein n=1 Tax=Hirundo rustica rustica TaxID=333673 RepID=A0A3M0K4B9_HIRRU|nr:hypothetical protein DUI87_21099 [Hirundo rustica rustica]
MIPGMEQLCWEERLESWDCSPGEEKPWGDLMVALQGLKETTRKMEKDFLQGSGVAGKGGMASQRQNRFRWETGQELVHGGGEALAQGAQSSCGAPGSLEVPKARLKQPGTVEGVPAMARVELDGL